MLGYPIGTFLCYCLVGMLAERGGWRLPFILAAIPGLALGIADSAPGDTRTLATFLTLGWLLYFMYFVTVYPTVIDVVDASRRGIAMAVLYFVANVIGGGAGMLLTGTLSDRFARQIMHASEVTERSSKIKGEGLNLAVQYTVPGGILLGGIMMLFALHYYRGTRGVRLART